MAQKEGWIKTYRKIQDCWIWQIDKPFDERSAWIDLLLSANHKQVKIQFNGELILVERGQFITSVRKLSDKWKWNKDKTLKFLRLLESDKMIKRDSDKYRTLITIENYEVYQDKVDTERTVEGTPQGTVECTQDGQEPATNKNEKNEKNIIKPLLSPLEGETEEEEEPKKRSRFTPPSVDEVRAYCEERRNGIDAQAFFDFYESKGWFVGKNKMKDWKAAVRTWERNRTGNKTDNPQSDIKSRLSNFAKGGN